MHLAKVRSIRELADWYGYSYGRVANWSKRGAVPEEELARAVELAASREPKKSARTDHGGGVSKATRLYALEVRREPIEVNGADVTFNLGDDRHFEVIPRFSARVSAGRGDGEQHDEQVGEFAFEVSWMRRNSVGREKASAA